MGAVVGVIVGVLVLAAIAWGQYGAIFSRQYKRDDPGVRRKEEHE